ncbi:LemA family protein [Acaryochloris sp. IP29b_bin.137]|uniref:LemA family protein n=1 Tax=Acaryochloris sp. IP29b_bin.137 TaxID=2969217 RepID=UPI0026157333|nr:LemA family protein [Acaryochloris sp. IP29b_bin.137]
MNSDNVIPEDLVPIVLEKAGQLYLQQTGPQGYSLEQLMDTGSEAQIPPELIQQAYQQLQQEQAEAKQGQATRRQQLKIGGAIATTVAVLGTIWVGGTYNHLTAARSTVEGKWAQVENQLQRRADLIPQLTQIAQSYASTEKEIIQTLTQAQTAFLQAETIAQQSEANETMQDAIANFQSLATRYPQLQSSQLFINLQYEIAGTENRIATERMRFNQAVQVYNQSLQAFPTVLVAKNMDFKPHPYFQRNSQ